MLQLTDPSYRFGDHPQTVLRYTVQDCRTADAQTYGKARSVRDRRRPTTVNTNGAVRKIGCSNSFGHVVSLVKTMVIFLD